MQLTMIGGGGFRTPLVHRALLSDQHEHRITDVVLYDTDPQRIGVIEKVLIGQRDSSDPADAPSIRTSTDLREALSGADFVFSAIRVGGLSGRVADERVALGLGLLGQETTGPGGISYGLRTIPIAMQLGQVIAEVAPRAWVINFTNPAGMITEAMQRVLGDRVVGICDSPLGLARRAARALGTDLDIATLDYSGLNHLGWLHGIRDGGQDRLPELLADAALLESFEEGKLFGADWLQDIGTLPNEYLYYYYFTREAIAGITGADATRGEFLRGQQGQFYADAIADADPWQRWEAVRSARDAAYMAEARSEGEERDAQDVAGGGYEGVALALMGALARGERAHLILNVRNGSTLPMLDADAVIEVPCRVDTNGIHPLPVSAPVGHAAGLVTTMKQVERLTIAAADSGSPRIARTALGLHPLVDSATIATELLSGYRAAIPEVDAVFSRTGGR
ncbi:6-phospho-beta-glucosidase [Dermacoccaceae bacterium W4C1]